MEEKILLLDDDLNLINSIKRQLKGKFDCYFTTSPKEALIYLQKNNNIAVIISDYKMPLMNGAEFLNKTIPISPQSIRIMLTGQADIDAIVSIINDGNIFRFLTKPCPPGLFIKNIEDAIKQFRLEKVEKELLSKTLTASIQVMMDIMVLAKPSIFNRSIRLKKYIAKVLNELKVANKWQIEIASVLSHLGFITIPDEIIKKLNTNEKLDLEDTVLYQLYTKTSNEIISKIPRLEHVAKIIKYQEKDFDGEGLPADKIKGSDIPFGSRVIKIAIDYDKLIQQNFSHEAAISSLGSKKNKYDTEIIKAFGTALSESTIKRKYSIADLEISELNSDMYIANDIISKSGVILGSSKQKISKVLIQTLKNYKQKNQLEGKIKVLVYTN